MTFQTQRVALPYFVIALLLFALQVTVGLWLALQYVVTVPQAVVDVFPFATSRAMHTNLLVLWLLLGFMGATFYLVPEEAQTELAWPKLAYFQLVLLVGTGVAALVGFLFGWTQGRPLLEISDAEIAGTFDVNALAPIWTTRAFLPTMIERGRGHIVTIASAAGLIGVPRLTDYAASKHAVVGFDDALRAELRHLGHRQIRTTVVCSYFISTGLFEGASASSPLLPILTPEYAARQIVRAIRRGRRRLLLPRTVAVVYLARLLPVPILDWIARALGVTRSMDGFRGRRT